MRAISNAVEVAKIRRGGDPRRHLLDPGYRVFPFDSRATGSAAIGSDIGIDGPAPAPGSASAAIEDEEASTLFTIDVVDFARVPEKFRAVARRRIPLSPERSRCGPISHA